MDFTEQDIRRVSSAVRRSRPDVAVLFLGEMPYTEFMGNIGDLRLADNQLDLVRAVRATGTPVVAVFVEGRPRTFSQVEPDLDGVVMAYLAGDFAGPAIAKVLRGAHNPSGKLPFSWPREASSHTTYDRKHTEKHYSARPQYAFGSGLSYSPVQTTAIRLLNEGKVVLGDTLRIEVDLENKGDRPTMEVVMVFRSRPRGVNHTQCGQAQGLQAGVGGRRCNGDGSPARSHSGAGIHRHGPGLRG